MLKPNLPINIAESRNVIKVLQGASYQIPDTVSSPSPTGISSGLSPTTIFDAKRATVGGQIVTSFSDTAGNAVVDVATELRPGDTVAVGAAGATCTVTITSLSGTVRTVGPIPSTAVAGVILVWG
jgi:hypothetical protein